MIARRPLRTLFLTLSLGFSAALSAHADDEAPLVLQESTTLQLPTAAPVESTLDKALDLLGIRYRWGGSKPETGFDCSGFVRHVFREGLGLDLPRSAREQSRAGEPVARDELQPGDLVFFNTMRRAFSHVGIYLGDNRFVHAPHRGGRVRVEDMSGRYWTKRFNGARRITEQ
ncbi:MAG: C40 family peptidase [Rhodocyclales bacterium]|nr:C40 family peptidase [Rhodocyclales bacterium]